MLFRSVISKEPWFVFKNWPQMLMHTFRGSSLRSMFGLESDRKVFERYRAIRAQERVYL